MMSDDVQEGGSADSTDPPISLGAATCMTLFPAFLHHGLLCWPPRIICKAEKSSAAAHQVLHPCSLRPAPVAVCVVVGEKLRI